MLERLRILLDCMVRGIDMKPIYVVVDKDGREVMTNIHYRDKAVAENRSIYFDRHDAPPHRVVKYIPADQAITLDELREYIKPHPRVTAAKILKHFESKVKDDE